MTGQVWSFDEARDNCRRASEQQRQAEQAVEKAYRQAAQAEEAYRVALAAEIVRQHDAGVAWSVAADVARGAPTVAGLRLQRDIAAGVREALGQAVWRATADRKDAQRFSDWSMRRELAEHGGPDQRLAWTPEVVA